jgi:hypothetical protein
MRMARYFLLRRGGEWLVTLEGNTMARCASRTEAIECAIVMADLMGAMHHDADVMAETDGGDSLELIWSFGRDKMPKKLRKRREPDLVVASHVKIVQRGEVHA